MGLKKVVGGLLITLGVMDKPFNDGFKRAGKSLKRFEGGLSKTAKRLIAFGASYLAIRKVTSSINSAMQSIDRLAKTSDKLGIATENLAGLQYAASRTGVDVRKLDMGLQRMTRRIAEAGQGTGEARNALRELGLDAADLARKSPDKQFLDIADAMDKVTNQADRVRLGFKLFDAEGVDLINTLRLGRRGIANMQAQASKMGLTMTRGMAKGVEDANDALKDLGLFLDGVARTAAAQLAPVITMLSKEFIKWATEGEPLGVKLSYVLETITISALEVAYAIRDVAAAIRDTYNGTKEFFTQDVKLKALGIYWGKLKDAISGDPNEGKSWADVERERLEKTTAAATTLEGRIKYLREFFSGVREQAKENAKQQAEDIISTNQFAISEMVSLNERASSMLMEIQDLDLKASASWAAAKKRHLDEIAEKEKDDAKKRWAAIDKEQQIRQSNFDFIAGGLRDIVSNSNMSAKEQFKVNKALNIAEATMNTATAITGYLSKGNYPMAITAGIIGAAQVAAISSTTFDGGGTIAAVSGAESTAATQAEPSRMVNINLGDNRGRFSREEIMSIMDGVSEAVGDGVQFNFA